MTLGSVRSVALARLWVAELLVSAATAEKVTNLHHVEVQDVGDAVDWRFCGGWEVSPR
jgi:hypothetical protein